MEIKYDKEVDIIDIILRKGTFHTNKKIDERTILDLDKEGNILSIEILDASKRKINLPDFDIHIKKLILAENE